MSTHKGINKIQGLLLLLVIIVLVCTYLGISQETIDFIIQLVVSMIIGTIFSMLAETIVKSLFGDSLNKYLLIVTFPIGSRNIKVSVSAFFLVTFIVAVLLRNLS